jgi:hypothetical protein
MEAQRRGYLPRAGTGCDRFVEKDPLAATDARGGTTEAANNTTLRVPRVPIPEWIPAWAGVVETEREQRE